MSTDGERARGRRDAWLAFAAYVALTIVMTWPLGRGLARDIPSDFGDPLLNTWILAWDADHLLRAVEGRPAVLGGYWHANIYYPHPYALAYSEHLTAQAIEILPVYALTRSPLLCYNVLFLSTFALSGLGMYLLSRDLTADRAAAFVAGLAFAFAPYRFGSLPHVQVLSSAWMPLALLGFQRFFATGRTAPLAGAAAAWLAQNLSCSYYLIFFSPVIAIYVAWELTRRSLWTDARAIGRVVAAAAIVTLATVPFVMPYLQLRRLGFMPRSIAETSHFSADVYAYLTASSALRVWQGTLQTWPRAEGWLFPGVTIGVLAAVAIVVAWVRARNGEPGRFAHALSIALAASATLTVMMLFGWSLKLTWFRITSPGRAVVATMAIAAALLGASPRARRGTRAWLSSPVGIFTIVTAFAVVMSFGPRLTARGRTIADVTPYSLLYDYVPGFDGLRAPARFGMIVALGLAALAGCGAAAIGRLRRGRILVALAGALIVVESLALPFPLNGTPAGSSRPDLEPLPDFVLTGDGTPAVYRYIAQLPATDAILELPFGEEGHEVRYMFYSIAHWHPLVNGYSGGAPDGYGMLKEDLKEILERPDAAWRAINASGARTIVVHEPDYVGDEGSKISEWLRTRGGRQVAAFGGDRVFRLP